VAQKVEQGPVAEHAHVPWVGEVAEETLNDGLVMVGSAEPGPLEDAAEARGRLPLAAKVLPQGNRQSALLRVGDEGPVIDARLEGILDLRLDHPRPVTSDRGSAVLPELGEPRQTGTVLERREGTLDGEARRLELAVPGIPPDGADEWMLELGEGGRQETNPQEAGE